MTTPKPDPDHDGAADIRGAHAHTITDTRGARSHAAGARSRTAHAHTITGARGSCSHTAGARPRSAHSHTNPRAHLPPRARPHAKAVAGAPGSRPLFAAGART